MRLPDEAKLPPRSLTELIDRVRPFVAYLKACGMDETAESLRTQLEGRGAEDDR